MKNYRFMAAVTCGILLAGSFVSCNSGTNIEKEKEKTVPPEVEEFIRNGTKILTEENCFWESWEYDFSYPIGDKEISVNIQCVNTYDKNGREHSILCYYDAWDGKPLVRIEFNWNWSMEYDPDLETIFMEGYFLDDDHDIIITNLNMTPSDFNLLDSEYRLWMYGNAYTNNEEPGVDEDELYGTEIIDLTKNVLVLQNLETGELMRYEKKYGKPTIPTPESGIHEEDVVIEMPNE